MTSSEPDLRERGKLHFANDELDEASECFREHLRLHGIDVIVASNLAEVRLRLGDWDGAVESASQALAVEPNHAKSLFRKARALVGLAKYADAQTCLQHPELASAKEARALLKSCEAYLQQSQAGVYDWPRLLARTLDEPEAVLDVADYQGPITVQPIPGKGMGVIASEDLKEGTLLVVAKAVEVLFPSQLPKATGARYTGQDNAGDSPATVELQRRLLKSLQRRVHVKRQVLELSRGGHEPTDTTCSAGEDESSVLRHILTANKFGWDSWSREYGFTTPDGATDARGLGLWLLPSRFNHSCLPNCARRFVGDLLVIRTTLDVARGTELTLAYLPLEEGGGIDQATGKGSVDRFASWGFTCACDWCAMQAGPPHLKSVTAAAGRDDVVALDWRLAGQATYGRGPEEFRLMRDVAMGDRPDPQGRAAAIFHELAATVQDDLTGLPWPAVHYAMYPLSMVAGYMSRIGRPQDAALYLDKLYDLACVQPALASQRPAQTVLWALQAAVACKHAGNATQAKEWLARARARLDLYWPGVGSSPLFDRLFASHLNVIHGNATSNAR